jgi:hypothetical protein
MSGDLSQGKTRTSTNQPGVARTFATLYSSWKTILTNVIFFAAYYLLFYEMIVHSNAGFFLLTIPFSLVVLFVLASSVLATVAVSYIRLSLRRRRSLPGVAQSPIGVALGAIVVGCSCNLPLLAPVMYFIGLNSIEVSGVISFLAAYQRTIIEAIVVINALSIYYYLRLISGSTGARRQLRDEGRRETIAAPVNNTVNPIN